MTFYKVGDPYTNHYIKPNHDGSINLGSASSLNVNIGSVTAEVDVGAFKDVANVKADAQVIIAGSNWYSGSFIPVLAQVSKDDQNLTTATANGLTLTTTGRLKTQDNIGSINSAAVATGYGLGSVSGILRVASARDARGYVLPSNYVSPLDGTGSFGTGSTILCAGWPFTVDDANCMVTYVQVKPSGGSWESPYLNGQDGIGLIGSNNEIRITGATPFAASDAYRIGIRYQDKGYTTASDSLRVEEIDPISEKYVEETLGSQSFLGSGTTYYPGSSGMSMAGYKDLSIQYYFDTSATGSTQLRVYASNDTSSPPNQWVNITPAAFQVDTNTAVSLGSIQYYGGAIGSGLLDYDNINFKSVRVQVDNLGSVADYAAIWIRRKA